MRLAIHIAIAYLLMLLVTAASGPLGWYRLPELSVLYALYFGLTAEHRPQTAVVGGILLGHLADLVGGTPLGTLSLVGGVVALVAHLVHHRAYLEVRGWISIAIIAAATSWIAALLTAMLRARASSTLSFGDALDSAPITVVALATAVTAPLLFRFAQGIDRRLGVQDARPGQLSSSTRLR